MPIATIHVLEERYDERRISEVSTAVQDALVSVLKIPPDDFFQIVHALPRKRFLHTPSFLGLKYSDDFMLLELAFISGRSKETRLALLKELNALRDVCHSSMYGRRPAIDATNLVHSETSTMKKKNRRVAAFLVTTGSKKPAPQAR